MKEYRVSTRALSFKDEYFVDTAKNWNTLLAAVFPIIFVYDEVAFVLQAPRLLRR